MSTICVYSPLDNCIRQVFLPDNFGVKNVRVSIFYFEKKTSPPLLSIYLSQPYTDMLSTILLTGYPMQYPQVFCKGYKIILFCEPNYHSNNVR